MPPDTTVAVHWSAGQEPVFHLDDPSSWADLQTANIVCDIDNDKPPPKDLQVLECALWTSGPTEVTVSAKGFLSSDGTYSPSPSTDCNPDPTPIEIGLEPSTD